MNKSDLFFEMPIDCAARHASSVRNLRQRGCRYALLREQTQGHIGMCCRVLSACCLVFVPYVGVDLQALDLHTFMDNMYRFDDNINAAMGLRTFDH